MKHRGFTITELSVTIAVSTVLLLAIVALIVSSQSYSQFRTVDALLDDELSAIESGVNSFINEIDTLGEFGDPIISGGENNNSAITFRKEISPDVTDEAKLIWDPVNFTLSGYIEVPNKDNTAHVRNTKTYAQIKSNKMKTVNVIFTNDADEPNVIKCVVIANVTRDGKQSEANSRTYTFIVVKRTTTLAASADTAG